jgi:hypothetical protein
MSIGTPIIRIELPGGFPQYFHSNTKSLLELLHNFNRLRNHSFITCFDPLGSSSGVNNFN